MFLFWELMLKKTKKEAPLADPAAWWDRYITRASIEALPIRVGHIAQFDNLPDLHKDPFDRMLIAQAAFEDMTIVTADEAIAQYNIIRDGVEIDDPAGKDCRTASGIGRRSSLGGTADHRGALEAQNRRTVAEHTRLEERLARVEKSAVFRTLRAIGHAGHDERQASAKRCCGRPCTRFMRSLSAISPLQRPSTRRGWKPSSDRLSPPAVLAYRPYFSVLMPVYRPRREWIEAAVASVQAQSYDNWQLCICCDGPADPWLDDWLRRRSI